MKLFCRKEKEYTVCATCRVHFEPYGNEYATDISFADRCPKCRKPLVEVGERKRVVMDWIERHWEEYEEAAKKEAADRKAAMASAMRASLAASGSSPLNALSGAACHQGLGNHLSGRYQQE